MEKKEIQTTEPNKTAFDEDIGCKFVGIPLSSFSDKGEKKCGIYSQTQYTIVGYGVNKWVVSAYLEVDNLDKILFNISEDELVERCCKKLSEAPPRKKFQKKEPVSPYGNLYPLPITWSEKKYYVKKRDGYKNQLIVQFVTDQRRNTNFWYEGPSLLGEKTKKKPGRKKKEK